MGGHRFHAGQRPPVQIAGVRQPEVGKDVAHLAECYPFVALHGAETYRETEAALRRPWKPRHERISAASTASEAARANPLRGADGRAATQGAACAARQAACPRHSSC